MNEKVTTVVGLVETESWFEDTHSKTYYYSTIGVDKRKGWNPSLTKYCYFIMNCFQNICHEYQLCQLRLVFTWSPLSITIFNEPSALWRRRNSCSAAAWASISLSISTTIFKFLYPSSGIHLTSGTTSTTTSYLTTSSEAWTPAVSDKMITL